MQKTIDLNADVGESYGAWRMGNDAALVPLVSSANIACGFHAGDPATMRASVELCLRHGVSIGAHPSYPDREGFGRRDMSLSPNEIHDAIVYQIGALAAIATASGARLAHVKPHGALYNRAAVDMDAARSIAAAVKAFDPALSLMGLAGSCLVDAGREVGLRVLVEGFADRRYDSKGRLVARGTAGALIEDVAFAEAQALGMIRDGAVYSIDGNRIELAIDTLCLHGDSPQAVGFATRLRSTLQSAGVRIGTAAG